MHSVTPAELGGTDKSAVVIGPFGSSLKTSDFRDSGVPLIFVRDIRTGDFSKPRAFVSEEKASELKAHLALPGDLVVTKMGDPPGDVAIYDGHVPAVITADCIRLRPTDRYNPRYLLHAFRAPQVRQQVLDITSGAAQKKVSLERFRTRVAVPVPSPDEQRRIAAILDHADAIRAKRRQILVHLDALTQAVFDRMFDDRSFSVALLEGLVEIRSSLVKPDRATMGDLPHIGPDSLTTGRGVIAGWRTIAEDGVTSGKYRFESGDVLYSKIRPNLNKVATASFGGLCSADIYALVPRPSITNAAYVEHTLRSPRFLRYADSLSNRANIPKLNRKQLARYALPVPPLDLQTEFADRAAAIDQMRVTVSRAASAEDDLFDSLQSRAFRGEL